LARGCAAAEAGYLFLSFPDFRLSEFVDKLPKTRSGKIMRRVLKAKELGMDPGDISTLED
jgi:acyl-coenzyme A synthetase/AMP-(fatty) acid ligase